MYLFFTKNNANKNQQNDQIDKFMLKVGLKKDFEHIE